jgi:DNA-binding NarL/FixJ family response regulator
MAFALPLRVLLVDDNGTFTDSLRSFLADEAWLQVVGAAKSGSEALARIDELHPDLVLMDLNMPEMNGLEATVQIKHLFTGPRVLLVSFEGGLEYELRAREALADGFIVKHQVADKLLPKINSLFQLDGVDAYVPHV